MDYNILKFLDTTFEEVAIAPSVWLLGEDKCYWPPYWRNRSKMTNALRKKEPPNTDTWKLHDTKILQSFRSYEEAERKLPLAEITSDLGSDQELGRGKRKKVRRISSSGSSYEDPAEFRAKEFTKPNQNSNACSKERKLAKPPSISLHWDKNCSREEVVANTSSDASDALFSNVLDVDNGQTYESLPEYTLTLAGLTPDTRNTVFPQIGYTKNALAIENKKKTEQYSHQRTNETEQTRILQELVRKIEILAVKVDNNGDTLGAILDNMSGFSRCVESEQFDHIRKLLSLKSVNDVDSLEHEIRENPQARTFLVQHLGRFGGKFVTSTTYRVMEELMTDDVAKLYSYAGQGQHPKLAFSQLEIKRCVCDAVRLNKRLTPSEHDVEEAVKYWLKRANTRLTVQANR